MLELRDERSDELLQPISVDLGGRVNDAIVMVLTGPMAVVCLASFPSYYFDWPGFKQESSIWTEAIISIPLSLFGLFLLWACIGNAWRLFAGKPDAVIDEIGITLHPATSNRFIPWAEVAASRVRRIDMGRAGIFWWLELTLTMPIRSWGSVFLPSRTISLQSRNRPMIRGIGRAVRSNRLAAGWKR